jgi:hypothetical protein
MPPGSNEARVAAGSESRYQMDDDAKHSTDATPWLVVIDGKRRGQLYGRYVTRAGAEAIARQLRGHGLAGRVEGPA